MTQLRGFWRKNGYFIYFFGALFTVFLWPLVFLKKTFLFGDYAIQHLPWAFHYAESLKSGHLPYWTNLIACGFPLVAEGQIGAYYLPHLVSYLVLPFTWAYTWGIPVHILIGGLGFYVYMNRLGFSRESAVLATVVFSFSSAYGGCFYNTATLRTLTWLPWALYILETKEGPLRVAILKTLSLAVCLALMWTAGFAQLALYAIGYLGLVMLLKRKLSGWVHFGAANLIAIFLSLPQLAATSELIPLSVRAGESADFALWGSVVPPAFLGLIYPEWGSILRTSFYVGILPLLFVLFSVSAKNKSSHEKIHTWLLLIFCLLALGKYNPIYAAAVKSLGITALRNPSKFLFFSAVSMSVLAGAGFERLFANDGANARKRIAFAFAAVTALLPVLGTLALTLGRSFIEAFGNRYAEAVLASKSDPMNGIAYYRAIVETMILQTEKALSLTNPWNSWVILISVLSAIVIANVSGNAGSKKYWRHAIAALVVLDLALFGFYFGAGFIGNARPLPLPQAPAMIATIRSEQSVTSGNLIEWAAPGKELATPNLNMLFGVSHAGGYSPLLLKRYYDLTKHLGIVDASLGRHAYSKEVWRTKKVVLDSLGVDRILSDAALDLPGTQLLAQEGDRFLYENKDEHPPLYAISGDALVRPLSENVGLYEAQAEFNLASPAMVVARIAAYPRWKVSVDGALKELIVAKGAFSAVQVDAGHHTVRFFYDKTLHRFTEAVAVTAWIVVLIALLMALRRRRV